MPARGSLVQDVRDTPEKALDHEVFQSLGPPGSASLMRHFFDLQQMTVRRQIDHPQLARAVADFCSDASSLLDRTVEYLLSMPVFDKRNAARGLDGFDRVFKACSALERCLSVLFQAYRWLFTARAITTPQARYAAYSMIRFLSGVLTQFHTLSVHFARHRIALAESRKAGHSKRAKPRAFAQDEAIDGDHTLALQHLASILLRAFSLLSTPPSDEKSRKHNAVEGHGSIIFQALFSTFLAHLGRVLSQFIFDPAPDYGGDQNHAESTRPRPANAHLPQPQSITPTKADEQEVRLLAATLEAKPLVQILRLAMKAAGTSLEASQNVWKARTTAPSPQGTGMSVSPALLVKLQHTLLKGVFGDNGEAFKDSLEEMEIPEDPGGGGPAAEIEDLGHGDWFTKEVWACVGWDILTETFERGSGTKHIEDANL